MKTYHKIQTVWLRDPDTKFKTLLNGKWAKPEFEYLKHNMWVFTEKVDGTNIRVIWDGKDVEFRGKSDNAQLHPKLVAALQAKFTADKMNRQFDDTPACLYGEGYGEKIQSGGKYRKGQGFTLFDVLIGDMWLERSSVVDIADGLDCSRVPVLGVGSLAAMIELVSSGDQKSKWGDFIAEGIVARPEVEMFNRRGERIITKLKAKDFPKGI